MSEFGTELFEFSGKLVQISPDKEGSWSIKIGGKEMATRIENGVRIEINDNIATISMKLIEVSENE